MSRDITQKLAQTTISTHISKPTVKGCKFYNKFPTCTRKIRNSCLFERLLLFNRVKDDDFYKYWFLMHVIKIIHNWTLLTITLFSYF